MSFPLRSMDKDQSSVSSVRQEIDQAPELFFGEQQCANERRTAVERMGQSIAKVSIEATAPVSNDQSPE